MINKQLYIDPDSLSGPSFDRYSGNKQTVILDYPGIKLTLDCENWRLARAVKELLNATVKSVTIEMSP